MNNMGEIGKIGFTLDGAWSNEREYLNLCVVQHKNGAYASRVKNKGVEPGTDESVWQLISYVGSDGKGLVVIPDTGNIGYYENGTLVDSGIPASASIDLGTIQVDFTPDEEATNIESNDTVVKAFSRLSAWWTHRIGKLKGLAFKDKVDYNNDIENAPTIPSKVSELTNDSSYQNATQLNTAITNHNGSNVAHNDIRTELASVKQIAEGALVGYAFDTVEAMNIWIAVAANKAKLKVGNSLFIRATNVPDYWWDGAQALASEAEKVDLSGYLLSSVAANTYVAKEAGKGLSANDFTADHKAYIDFLLNTQELASIVNIPSTAANTDVSISANAALSVLNPENLKPGYVMTIRINNTATAARTVTLPSSANWINDYGTTLEIAASSRAEVSVWCFKDGFYSIRVGEVG